jgi:hypothetical protein
MKCEAHTRRVWLEEMPAHWRESTLAASTRVRPFAHPYPQFTLLCSRITSSWIHRASPHNLSTPV